MSEHSPSKQLVELTADQAARALDIQEDCRQLPRWASRTIVRYEDRSVELWNSFKNFHRLLCERFGYVHDENDWQRDQLSLIEHIAQRASAPPQGAYLIGIKRRSEDGRSEYVWWDTPPEGASIYAVLPPTKPAASPPCVFRTGCVNGQSCVDAGHCTHGAEMLAAMNGAAGETSKGLCRNCKQPYARDQDGSCCDHPSRASSSEEASR